MRRITSLVAAAAASLLASAAPAQMTRVNDTQFETIVSVSPDASAMIVQDAAGRQRTILLNQGTSITREGRPGTTATTIRLGEIGVGDRIVIDGAARQGGFTANRVQVFGPGVVSPPPPGVVSPGATPGVSAPGSANPASPPTGTGAPDGSNPASPPPGTGAPDGSNPASPPGSVRPGDPNTAAPGGSSANPASPPGGGGAANPAAPPM